MMRLIFVVLLIGHFSAAGDSSRRTNNKAAGLALNITVEEMRACAGDRDVYSDILTVATRYTNTTADPITVFEGSDVATEVLVAKNADDLKERKYEVDSKWHVYPTDNGEVLLGQKGQQREIVVQPGASIDGKNTAAVVIRKRPSDRIPGTIPPGSHVLQVGMLVKILDGRGRANDHGMSYRWIYVPSNPIEINIEDNAQLQDCSGTSSGN